MDTKRISLGLLRISVYIFSSLVMISASSRAFAEGYKTTAALSFFTALVCLGLMYFAFHQDVIEVDGPSICYIDIHGYTYTVEMEQEDDQRWVADMVSVPGVMVYGATQQEALDRCRNLALAVLVPQPTAVASNHLS